MVLAYIMALAHIIVLVVKLAVNLYYDVACVMVSARVKGLSVNPHYNVSLYYGVSPCYNVTVLLFQLLTHIVK